MFLPVPFETGGPSGFFRLVPAVLQQTVAPSTTADTAPAATPLWKPDRPKAAMPPYLIIDHVDISLGDGIALEKYGWGSVKIFINVANEKKAFTSGWMR